MSNNIDKIIYINLEHRNDRKEQIESELNNMCVKYERYNAIYTPGNGPVGCALSHLNVLKLAKERNYKNVLIIEDDFTFLVDKNTFENILKKLFSSSISNKFDVCMLGYNLIRYSELEEPLGSFLYKIVEAQTASAYIVNQHYYDKLIELFEYASKQLSLTRIHWIYSIDQIWKPLQLSDNWYCFNERIGKQRASFSDNSEKWVDYNC